MDQAHAVGIPYLIEVAAFLLTVVIIVPVFRRLKVSPILGYLAVGAIIGPYSLGVVPDAEGVRHVAELGVIFLLFTIGLELSFERLKVFSKWIFGLGSVQVVFCALAIGFIAYTWGNSLETAIVIGLCLALSSTAMTMQILSERGEIATPAGRITFSVLLFQDLAVVPVLILVSVLGDGGSSNVWLSVSMSILKALIVVGVIVGVGRYALRFLFRTASQTHSVDVFTAMTLLTVFATSLATGMAGLSMALGAFLAGLLLAETEFRHQIEAEIEPFKGLLLGLFFMSVGMSLNFALAFERGIWVVLSVIGLIVLKTAITFGCALLFRLPIGPALRAALLLSEGGEFAFVVIGQATLTYGLMDEAVGQFMVVVAGLSMLLTPVLAILAKRVEAIWVKPGTDLNIDDALNVSESSLGGHVIIAGFGRVGRAVAAVLKSEAIPYLALDTETRNVKSQRENGEPVYVGDAAKADLLVRAGIDNAAAVLITMDNAQAAIGTVETIKQRWPHLPILVRAKDVSHSDDLAKLGVTNIVPETLEASLQLSGHVLCALGYPREDANACIDVIRRHNYDELKT